MVRSKVRLGREARRATRDRAVTIGRTKAARPRHCQLRAPPRCPADRVSTRRAQHPRPTWQRRGGLGGMTIAGMTTRAYHPRNTAGGRPPGSLTLTVVAAAFVFVARIATTRCGGWCCGSLAAGRGARRRDLRQPRDRPAALGRGRRSQRAARVSGDAGVHGGDGVAPAEVRLALRRDHGILRDWGSGAAVTLAVADRRLERARPARLPPSRSLCCHSSGSCADHSRRHPGGHVVASIRLFTGWCCAIATSPGDWATLPPGWPTGCAWCCVARSPGRARPSSASATTRRARRERGWRLARNDRRAPLGVRDPARVATRRRRAGRVTVVRRSRRGRWCVLSASRSPRAASRHRRVGLTGRSWPSAVRARSRRCRRLLLYRALSTLPTLAVGLVSGGIASHRNRPTPAGVSSDARRVGHASPHGDPGGGRGTARCGTSQAAVRRAVLTILTYLGLQLLLDLQASCSCCSSRWCWRSRGAADRHARAPGHSARGGSPARPVRRRGRAPRARLVRRPAARQPGRASPAPAQL